MANLDGSKGETPVDAAIVSRTVNVKDLPGLINAAGKSCPSVALIAACIVQPMNQQEG